MDARPSSKRSIFDSPSTYEIRVQGALAAGWSSRLEGMAIVTTLRDDGTPMTTLSGQLADQAALAGVLDCLYSLRLPVLSVSRLENNS